MLTKEFLKRKVMVIGAMVFLLTMFALNLDALLFRGKPDVPEAHAAVSIHWRHATIINGQVQCPEGGFDCVVIVLAPGKEITIPLI